MVAILFISTAETPAALTLLNHSVRQIEPDPALLASASFDLIMLDCRQDLASARSMARILQAAGSGRPLMLWVNEGALPILSGEWGLTDFVLPSVQPAELEARIRLSLESRQLEIGKTRDATGLSIDDQSYVAKINGRTLDLTFKEFELLRYLAENPGRVFSREQLLSEVWGYDYFGGTRTVDVHVRRLRAKLGESESLIGTVRNVGYRLNPEGGHGSDYEA
jgi:DNA-binding response OmpR family regulator